MYDIRYLNYIIDKDNVTFHHYRTAVPKLTLVTFDRDDRYVKRLEEHLYSLTGSQKDNHVLFEVKSNDCVLALQFSDSHMTLGIGVEKKYW